MAEITDAAGSTTEVLGLDAVSVIAVDRRRDLLVIAGFVLTVASLLVFAFPFASAVSDFGDACFLAGLSSGGDLATSAAPVCSSTAQRAAIWLPLACAVLAAGSGLMLTLAARYRRWPLPVAAGSLLLALVVFAVGSVVVGGLAD